MTGVGITVWEDDEVDGLDVWYERDNGTGHSIHIGGFGGVRNPTFWLHDDEDLIGINGRAGARVDQIQFVTTERSSGTYGGNGGTRFVRRVPDGKIVAGFHGREGNRVDAIGLSWE